MGGPKNKGYKRSWKNLLLNKSYQLRFTLFMVGLSALLMGLLGWWVLTVAHKATVTASNNIRGADCKNPLAGVEVVEQERELRQVTVETTEMQFVEPGTTDELRYVDPDEAAATPDSAKAGAGDAPSAGAADAPDDTTVVVVPPRAGPSEEEKQLAQKSYERCLHDQKQLQMSLLERERLIGKVLLGVGAMLVLGLFGFGIKMTHRVAGPLYKVGLYFKKLRDGKFDPVYSLRKGDHLVEFYEHFRSAHEGLRAMQEQGLEELRAMIEAAEKADLASKSPEIAATLGEMRAVLKRKEESLG
jgi:hypothetical protein